MSTEDRTNQESAPEPDSQPGDEREADDPAPTRAGRSRDPYACAPVLPYLESDSAAHRAAQADTIADAEDPGEPSEDRPNASLLARSVRFRDLGRIGTGGTGAVHLVDDAVLLRRVAMKSLHPRLAKRPEQTQRFLREVQITGCLDHPHIVPVHDVGFHEQGNAFFVMKYVDGETLNERIGRHRDQPLEGEVLEEYLRIFLKLTDAIGFSHSRGVVHRDLKPSNIMVGNHGEVYVMDWGIARALATPALEDASEPPEFDGSLLGTVGYMAPEQAEGRVGDIDFRTDIFGLGAILYEILTGRPPYVAGDASSQLRQAREGRVRDPMVVAGGRHVPPGLCRIAMKAMAKDPGDRYQSVAELEHAIDSFRRGGGWFETRSVDAGVDIVMEGQEADAAYIIESGTCEVYRSAGDERRVLSTLGPGDVFGETAIFTNKPRTASVMAREPVELVVITRDSLDRELGNGWLAVFVRALAERFCDLDRRLGERQTASSDDDRL